MKISMKTNHYLDEGGSRYLVEQLLRRIELGDIDLSDYVTRSEVQEMLTNSGINVDLSNYVSLTELRNELNNYYTKAQTQALIANSATKEYVDSAIAAAVLEGADIDTTDLATKAYVDSLLSSIDVSDAVMKSSDVQYSDLEDYISERKVVSVGYLKEYFESEKGEMITPPTTYEEVKFEENGNPLDVIGIETPCTNINLPSLPTYEGGTRLYIEAPEYANNYVIGKKIAACIKQDGHLISDNYVYSINHNTGTAEYIYLKDTHAGFIDDYYFTGVDYDSNLSARGQLLALSNSDDVSYRLIAKDTKNDILQFRKTTDTDNSVNLRRRDAKVNSLAGTVTIKFTTPELYEWWWGVAFDDNISSVKLYNSKYLTTLDVDVTDYSNIHVFYYTPIWPDFYPAISYSQKTFLQPTSSKYKVWTTNSDGSIESSKYTIAFGEWEASYITQSHTIILGQDGQYHWTGEDPYASYLGKYNKYDVSNVTGLVDIKLSYYGYLNYSIYTGNDPITAPIVNQSVSNESPGEVTVQVDVTNIDELYVWYRFIGGTSSTNYLKIDVVPQTPVESVPWNYFTSGKYLRYSDEQIYTSVEAKHYTKEETVSLLSTELNNYYDKAEVDTLLATSGGTSATYNNGILVFDTAIVSNGVLTI